MVSTHSRTEAAADFSKSIAAELEVSTHSRTEAAADLSPQQAKPSTMVSTHSRTEAAADLAPDGEEFSGVSTHSRTEAAATYCYLIMCFILSFNTQPHGGGCLHFIVRPLGRDLFQHTAARRRLLESKLNEKFKFTVSTHSRAEAAAVQG